MSKVKELAGFIWSVADEILRDSYKRSKYADVIYPFTVIRRLDCILEPTQEEVYHKSTILKKKDIKLSNEHFLSITGVKFYNDSNFTLKKLLNNPSNIKENFISYLNGFSENIQEIIEKFKFRIEIQNLSEKNLLYLTTKKFSESTIDLHPDNVSNHDMGYVFEELIRKFNESTNENPGEHFTPREIIHLMVNLLMSKDRKKLSEKGKIVSVYDPACGTGGMLTVAKEKISELNSKAKIHLFGQELNDSTYAACKADMLIKGENPDNIKYGSSFSENGFLRETFDYILSNPPYGKNWKNDEEFIKTEAKRGSQGRFEAGLPGISDGQLLFLQHMTSKMHKTEHRSRIAIVFNGSPLFNGDANEGESEIRRWICENDWLEAIIGLPNQLFYNTGINTYVWLLTNQKEESRKGKVALIDARNLFVKMTKSLGDKRNLISDDQIQEITDLYTENIANGRVKILKTTDFAYRKIQVERPLRLNFQISQERFDKVAKTNFLKDLSSALTKNGKTLKENDVNDLYDHISIVLDGIPKTLIKSHKKFKGYFENSMKATGIKFSKSLQKKIIMAFSEKDETAEIVYDDDNNPVPDSELRDYEYIPYNQDINAYFDKEVQPYASDAWINAEYRDWKDNNIGRVGYEINFNRFFYKYVPPRSSIDIQSDIIGLEKDIIGLLEELNK